MKKAIVVLGVFAFCIAASQNAWAKTNLGFNRLGVDVGLVDPEAVGSALGFGAHADLGTLAPNFRLSTHVNYWNKSESDFGAEISFRDISVGPRVRYMFPVSSPKIQPYAGAGLGVHFYNAKVEMPGFPSAEVSSTELGFDLGGGASMPLSPKTDLFADLWYTLSDVDHFSMKVGASFKLGQAASRSKRR
jgi:opacity protein-like surface antigen